MAWGWMDGWTLGSSGGRLNGQIESLATRVGMLNEWRDGQVDSVMHQG